MKTISQLAGEFAIDDCVSISEGPGAFPIISISNNAAHSRISLYGAHILSFKPQGQQDVLWMSAHSVYQAGTAIRGGIPICWPWFGAASKQGLPDHGFARLSMWQLKSTTQIDDSHTEIVFILCDNDYTRSLWPHTFKLEYQVIIGSELQCKLISHNLDESECTISCALHSYFAIGDLSTVQIRGLEGAEFFIGDSEGQTEDHAIICSGEIDRIYDATHATCYLDDSLSLRSIVIAKENSHSTVIWNPGLEASRKKADLGDDEYQEFFCIESGNIARDQQVLAGFDSHSLIAHISTNSIV
ncbi:MAG: D-hexose-6-phosphate mutarotase [Planctomycetes bacterium]|nr:D-hexose-6-phosphate mutarotase [Planctomycetota bacterium]